ncbi:MAG TPA: hypothetical protein VF030_02145, partial [Solirubrobacterales bacterium]
MSGAEGLDLFDGEHGVLFSVRPGRSAVVFAGDRLLGAEPAPDGLPNDVPIRAGGAELDVEVSPLAEPHLLRGRATGAEELTLVRAVGSLGTSDGATEVAAVGFRTRVQEPPGPELRRSLAVAFADGGMLAIAAGAPTPDAPHNEEETTAILTEPEGRVPIERALISIEYDGEGRQRRATVELWLPDESG